MEANSTLFGFYIYFLNAIGMSATFKLRRQKDLDDAVKFFFRKESSTKAKNIGIIVGACQTS